MITIQATIRNGRIEPEEPLDWPEGTRVQVSVPDRDDEPVSPGEITRVLDAMDRMEPLRLSEAEVAAWEADRQARREAEKAAFFARAENLRGMRFA